MKLRRKINFQKKHKLSHKQQAISAETIQLISKMVQKIKMQTTARNDNETN